MHQSIFSNCKLHLSTVAILLLPYIHVANFGEHLLFNTYGDGSVVLNPIIISIFFTALGVGVGMARDVSTLMVAQYFKRKRELVEIIVLSATGVGLSLTSMFINGATR